MLKICMCGLGGRSRPRRSVVVVVISEATGAFPGLDDREVREDSVGEARDGVLHDATPAADAASR